MGLLTAVFLLFSSSYALAVGTEYIMVELEPVQYERNIVKRQVQYAQDPRAVQYAQDPRAVQYVQDPRAVQYVQDPRALQYAQPAAPEQIPPEYINYLQQVQVQQLQAQQAQAQAQQALPQIPADIQQSLTSRAPQSFQQQPPQPARQPPVPEDQRRIQESFNQRPIQEQEREDQTNQQLLALGLNPTQVRRQRLRESAARLAAQQAEEQAARQAYQAAEQQQYYAQPQVVQTQLVPVPQEIPVQQQDEAAPQIPERVSYSQVAFGTTKLPQQRLLPARTQLIYTQPQVQQQQAQPLAYRQQVQAQPQQVVYQPQLVYRKEQERSSQPQRIVYAQPDGRGEAQLVYSQQGERQQVSYKPQLRFVQLQPQAQPQSQPQAEVTQKQHPDQYLIETTKKEPQRSSPKQQLSYRPQTSFEGLQASISAQRQRAQLAQQRLEAATTPAPRSSIFVTTARTPVQKSYSFPEYRIPKQQEMRPLTQTELNALINAGFSVTPSQQGYRGDYFRGLAKRQNNRPRIGRVPLSQEEKEILAKSGIRSLYRVETAESQDAPVTYVLAIENQKRDTDKSTSS